MSGSAGGGAARPHRVAFVRRGSLSHSNPSLLAALRRARPDLDFVDIDIDPLLQGDAWLKARGLLGALREYGMGSLRTGARLKYRFMRNTTTYRALRRLILTRIAEERFLFSIQTQSLWNASTGRCPHFVYTDHAALGREEIAWDDGCGDPGAAWLACEAEIYRGAAHVFTYGSNIRDLIVRRYGMSPERVSCGSTGPNIAPSQPPRTDAPRYARRRILFVGLDWERKGGPTLIDAFARLRRRLPDATLTIVGAFPPSVAGAPGVAAHRRVAKEELERFYFEASCLCVPSRMEPFGNVFVEALHFGLPIVATTVGGIGDVVKDGINGWRVPSGDADALGDALFRTISAEETASRMGRASLSFAADFTWDVVAERILEKAPAG